MNVALLGSMIDVDRITFCDLSVDLDRGLWLLVRLSEGLPLEAETEIEMGHAIGEYLSRRVVLEHVFFKRRLKKHSFDPIRLKAEVWRIQKMKALQELKKTKR